MKKPTKQMKQYYTNQVRKNKLFSPEERYITEFTRESEHVFDCCANKLNRTPTFSEYKLTVKRIMRLAIKFKSDRLRKKL